MTASVLVMLSRMRKTALYAVLAAAAVAAGCGGQHDGPSLTVSPSSALVDAPFRIRVTELSPGERLTITAFGHSRLGKVWRTVIAARADAAGAVDLENVYLLGRLRPIRPPAADDYLLWEQHLTIAARAHGTTRTVHADRILTPASVSVTDERPAKVGFYGEWFTPQGARRHTAILLLGGSEGGQPSYLTASMLAARGYPVLALAYFREPGLPAALENIPLEYFRRALEWMRWRREVDPTHIVTFGISRGGELSLLLVSTFPDLVHGAVSYVGSDVAIVSPTDVHQPAWTYRGKPVLGPISLEKVVGPVFAVGGGDDELWPSDLYVQDIEYVLRGHDRRDVTIVYPHAGHALGRVVPNQPELTTTVDSIYGRFGLGGSPQADEAAREDSWPRLLRFLAGIGGGYSS
jgi:dienelactone hydrolase